MMNSSVPKVSICIPVRNGGAFFREVVESALNQSYQNLGMVSPLISYEIRCRSTQGSHGASFISVNRDRSS